MCFCQIIPPSIHKHLAAHAHDPAIKQHALQQLAENAQAVKRRSLMTLLATLAPMDVAARSPAGKVIVVYDTKGTENLPGTMVRGNTDGPVADAAVNEAHDGLDHTYDFYKAVFQRNSIDGRDLNLVASVHYGQGYDNAFWDGSQMIFGDGDNIIFQGFTKCLDVIGHELTHGVTQYTAGLRYEEQSGALNESMSDCFGSMIKQWVLGQTSAQADWLIGAGLLAPGIHGVALRSMSAPGTAFDDPQLGKDEQPDHMSKYLNTWDDNGGVHYNSGITNKAFYLVAMALGGHSWEKAGPIWYRALTQYMRPSTDFAGAATATQIAATDLFGQGAELKAVTDAWHAVGVI